MSQNIIIRWMDSCFECQKGKPITILRYGPCDDKLKERIKKQIRDNWNWSFENNMLSKQLTRNNN